MRNNKYNKKIVLKNRKRSVIDENKVVKRYSFDYQTKKG